MSAVIPEVDAIQKAWAEYVRMEDKHGPREPHPYVYASSRRRCLRRMALECSRPADLPEFDAETKARFARGKRREIDISIDLQRVGQLCIPRFEFVGQQERVRVMDRRGRVVISGMIDGYIKWESGAQWPTEIKSLSAYTTDKVHTFEDLFDGRYTWANSHQILSYLFSKNAPFGMFVMDRSGLPKLLRVDLEKHLSAMESFLQDATVVVDHVEAGTLPDFSTDPDECRRCPAFAVLCNPPMNFAGSTLITDEELLAGLERRATLEESAKEFASLDEDIKDRLRGIPMAIAGKFLIEGKARKTTKTVWPSEEIKKQCQVSDPAGAWVVKITKVTD